MASRRKDNWQPSWGESLAMTMGTLLDERFIRWERELDEHTLAPCCHELLRRCRREIESDIEVARVRATPRPPVQRRSLIDLMRERDGAHEPDASLD